MMGEVTKHNIHERAMEWVNKMVKDWIREGFDHEQMFDRAWLRYGLVAYRANNTARKG